MVLEFQTCFYFSVLSCEKIPLKYPTPTSLASSCMVPSEEMKTINKCNEYK